MGRAPCCDKANVKKGPWSPEEDAKLKDFIQTHGTGGNWIALPQKAGLNRCGKSCRLRWLNYLRPNIKHGDFSQEEDATICSLFANIGSRWSIIASQLPGRTDNDIKNYWNTKLKKKFFCIISSQKKQQHQALFHHRQQQQQQHQNYFSTSSLWQDMASNIVTPKLELLTDAGFGSDTLNFASSSSTTTATPSLLLRAPYHPPQLELSNMINFGSSDPSCSSSGGSCTPISYGTEQLEYDHREQINAGIDNYVYGVEANNRTIFHGGGGGGGGIHAEAPLDYTFEEIRHLLSSNSGCNFGNSN